MLKTLFFVARHVIMWCILYAILVGTVIDPLISDIHELQNLVPLVGALLILFMAGSGFSHVRRVRLANSVVSLDTLANRHLQRIEVPCTADACFDMIDAAIRELPGCEGIDSARDSLQVRAKLRRIASNVAHGPLNLLDRINPAQRNQILATVTPNGEASSLTILCEPEHGAWGDWFFLDHGSNLDNAQALGRSIAQRIARKRQDERNVVQQTLTEKELSNARLSLLQAQVEPHFLYNTLASAQLLTRTDPARADVMLGNLIIYLRHSLPRVEDDMSTLGLELERACAYLEILQIRMGNRLQLQIDVPEHLKAVALPPMMLQTLVENAIKHGLEPKPGGGTVWILARSSDLLDKSSNGLPRMLSLTVADDGRGLNSASSGTGIGLANVRERLKLAYGGAASLTIGANFPQGVAATLSIPTQFAEGGQHG